EVLKTILLMFKMQSEYSVGKTKDARQILSQMLDISRRTGSNEFAASTIILAAQLEVGMGDTTDARSAIATEFAMAKDRDKRSVAALLMARIGDSNGAEQILSDLAKEFPHDTMLNSVWTPMARAFAEMRGNNPNKAIELLDKARPYEFGIGPNSCGA